MQATKKDTTQRASPFLLAAIALLIAIVGYFGTYYANLTSGRIVYPRLYTLPSVLRSDNSREVPIYRFAQEASEIIFLPADKIDGWLRPGRDSDPPEWREEWWE